MKKKYILLILCLFVLILASSCQPTDISSNIHGDLSPTPDPTATPTPTVNPEATPTSTVTPEPTAAPQGEFIFPKADIRPIAVMIGNRGDKVLPQGGIKQAQIVSEIVVEGGITRYMAVFWDTLPEMVGPVRSSRPYFLDYAMEYDSIYVHFGQSDQAYIDIEKFEIDNINGVANGGGAFYDLTNDPKNYQDSYTSPKKIFDYIDYAGYRKSSENSIPFIYNSEDTDLESDIMANDIFIKYMYDNYCGYCYDPVKKVYQRVRMGKPQTERNTGLEVEAKNIIVQFVNNHTIENDEYDRQELDNLGSGQGYLITNGKAIKIIWTKQERDKKTVYKDENGKEIKLNPGQTWIQIVSDKSKITIE